MERRSVRRRIANQPQVHPRDHRRDPQWQTFRHGLRNRSDFWITQPQSLPGVPGRMLQPKGTWDDPQAYESMAMLLAQKFKDNFELYQDEASAEVIAAGPQV